MSFHGTPCWFELSSGDPAQSGSFYAGLLGWDLGEAQMEGFSYGLASRDGVMVAGLMQPDQPGPDGWLIYFAVDDCDASAAQVTALGGQVLMPPADIPGTGRFSVVTDPQGVRFGLLQPLDDGPGGAFDQQKEGHGNWNELATSDPQAALAFYTALLGWSPSARYDMPDLGAYQLLHHQGSDIGGIMPLPHPGARPAWLPYFGVNSITSAMEKVTGGGGRIVFGPSEVPGGALICNCEDPRGANFALVGPA